MQVEGEDGVIYQVLHLGTDPHLSSPPSDVGELILGPSCTDGSGYEDQQLTNPCAAC